MLEAGPVDPDDPATFLSHYKSAWENAGFEPSTTEDGTEKWVWREGVFSVEVTHERGGEAVGPRQFGNEGGWEIYGFINNVPDDPENRSQSAYARKTTSSEVKALGIAKRLKTEITNSMAARLTKLGFTGWRNHWHKSPISVSLKKNYANISLDLRYVPNEKAIRVLTGMSKMVDRVLPLGD
jgi:hypothetical protein